MQCAIDDLQLKFDVVHNAMVGSGWAFQNVTDIRINMAKVEHRLVERTKKITKLLRRIFVFIPKVGAERNQLLTLIIKIINFGNA